MLHECVQHTFVDRFLRYCARDNTGRNCIAPRTFYIASSSLYLQYVNEVVIGAPYEVTRDLMEHFNVSIVCHGQTPIMPCEDGSDPYAEPKRQNKFKLLDSGNDMTTEKIVERIILHRYVLLFLFHVFIGNISQLDGTQ